MGGVTAMLWPHGGSVIFARRFRWIDRLREPDTPKSYILLQQSSSHLMRFRASKASFPPLAQKAAAEPMSENRGFDDVPQSLWNWRSRYGIMKPRTSNSRRIAIEPLAG